MTVPDSELLERLALEDIHEAATPALKAQLGIRGEQIGDAFVSIAAHLPPSSIVINRALGLGLSQPQSQDTIKQMARSYWEAGVDRFFIQLCPNAEPAEIRGWLEEEGLQQARGWQKFSRTPEPVESKLTDLQVREIDEANGEDFARIVCAAFDLGELAEPWLARIPGRKNWYIFMSFDGEEPAGAGAMFVHEKMAWFDFGATAPEFRCRGSQSAVMAARLEKALELECEKMFTCTGVDVEGDPQHSYKNILKAGFQTEYVRENYSPV